MSQPTEQAIELIRQAQRIAALSGAGISTEAGIPDFRGPQGLWNNFELMELMSARGFRRDPAAFYRATLKLLPNVTQAQPTEAHRLLARLEAEGKVIGVITQNIDGLHQAAGSQRVYEIHGTMHTGHCLQCGACYKMMPLYQQLERGLMPPPLCSNCQGLIKPDVVLFDELLPVDVWQQAERTVRQCDLLLVFGSSLVVYPAAGLPQIALEHQAKLIIVNLEETDYDAQADVVVRGKLGEFARTALARL
jgi:NAD-dependent deacetylase